MRCKTRTKFKFVDVSTPIEDNICGENGARTYAVAHRRLKLTVYIRRYAMNDVGRKKMRCFGISQQMHGVIHAIAVRERKSRNTASIPVNT